jgi:hypothetical protein
VLVSLVLLPLTCVCLVQTLHVYQPWSFRGQDRIGCEISSCGGDKCIRPLLPAAIRGDYGRGKRVAVYRTYGVSEVAWRRQEWYTPVAAVQLGLAVLLVSHALVVRTVAHLKLVDVPELYRAVLVVVVVVVVCSGRYDQAKVGLVLVTLSGLLVVG